MLVLVNLIIALVLGVLSTTVLERLKVDSLIAVLVGLLVGVLVFILSPIDSL